MPVLKDCSEHLRQACVQAVGATQAYLNHINTRRWTGKDIEKELSEALDEAQTNLQMALKRFKDDDRLALLKPFQHLLDSVKTRSDADVLPLRSLYACYVFAANLILTSESTSSLVNFVQITASKRRKNRVWAPTGLRAIAKLFTVKGDNADNVFGDEAQPAPTFDEDPVDAGYSKDPIRLVQVSQLMFCRRKGP